VSEQRRDQRAGDDAGDEEVVRQQDLSVPMWVWTLLGFVLVVAVIIVVIIIGGGQATPNEQNTGGQPETMSTAEPAEAETMPAEASTTHATPPG
jgi:hypothetical protein